MADGRRVGRVLFVLGALVATPAAARGVEFERVVIDDNFPGAYQVEVADVNGDRKPDVVAVGGGTCAWYENPSWKKRVVTGPKQTPGVISSATADLDGDGKAEIAIAYEFSMNEPAKGKLLLAHPGTSWDDQWTLTPVADVPSVHRLRWMVYGFQIGPNSIRALREDEPGPRTRKLVAAPIFGPSARPPAFQEEPAHLGLFDIDTAAKPPAIGLQPPARPRADGGDLQLLPDPIGRVSNKPGGARPREIAKAPVLHAIDVIRLQTDYFPEILGASNLGITSTHATAIVGDVMYQTDILVPGAQGEAPKKGCSEVHAGRLKDGRRFLTAVEPWHGTDVAVYLSTSLKPLKFGPRTAIDDTLAEGHALWVADVDGDGDDEVFAGHRGKDHRVSVYDFGGKTWNRTVIDRDIAAQDLRGGDVDGDGTPDVVAVGGATKNVVWYRPRAAKKEPPVRTRAGGPVDAPRADR